MICDFGSKYSYLCTINNHKNGFQENHQCLAQNWFNLPQVPSDHEIGVKEIRQFFAKNCSKLSKVVIIQLT
jgi:hypothetical protein